MSGDKKDHRQSPRNTGGPVVKTGPNSGQNRSRNKDGSWRGKRSDAGKSRKSGCFVSTAASVHKSLPDNCHELTVLRAFRDEVLLASPETRDLVHHYYDIAPHIAARLTEAADLDQVWEVVQNCVRAIEEGQYAHAIALYSETMLALNARFGTKAA